MATQLDKNDTSGVTHLDNALLSSAKAHDVLLCIEAASAHSQSQKQTPSFNERAPYCYAPFLCKNLKILHRSVCESHSSTFDEFLLVDISQTKSSSFSVNKICLDKKRIFAFVVTDMNELLAARAKTRAKCVVRAVAKHFALWEGQTSPAPTAEKAI